MPRILVVDDAAVDRRLIGGLLERRGDFTVQYAAHGMEALAMMAQFAPDVVLTDVTMPVMDGLELVTAMRVHFPSVPVILITAHGSEALAIEALERGAASYVPKSRLAGKLLATIDEVLSTAQASRSHQQLLRCLDEGNFRFTLDNEPALIDALVDYVQKLIESMGLCDFTARLRVGLALKEALLNAMFHGNLQITREEIEAVQDHLIAESEPSLVELRREQAPYRDRRIHVEVRLSRQEIRMVVRDDGPGFDVSKLPAPGDPAALQGDQGRGLGLIRTFMDEVTFNAAGNEITLVKRCA